MKREQNISQQEDPRDDGRTSHKSGDRSGQIAVGMMYYSDKYGKRELSNCTARTIISVVTKPQVLTLLTQMRREAYPIISNPISLRDTFL